MSDIKYWSSAAASNTSAPPDGWPEGMVPSGVNDCGREMMAAVRRMRDDAEWVDYGITPTYVNGTTFTVDPNYTARLHAGRRIRANVGSSTYYGTIDTCTYTTKTSVVVSMDSGSLSGSFTSFSVGILSGVNQSIPGGLTINTLIVGSVNLSTATASTVVALSSVITDTVSERSAGAGVTVDGCLIKDSGAAAVSDGTNVIKTKIISIGTWDMDANASKAVAHGLTLANIRSASATVRDDAGTTFYRLSIDDIVTGPAYYGIQVDATNVTLSRIGNGPFDNTNFDTMGGDGNRGWITITHVA